MTDSKNTADMLNPLISIVMPAYNAERYIAPAIQSVLDQPYPHFELIVVNDCSRDRTAEIIQEFAEKDPRIIFLQNEKNSGVCVTRNRAFNEAKGEWIALLDSDDMWRADKLELQLQCLRDNPDACLVYTASAFMDMEGNPFSYQMPVDASVTYNGLLRRNQISCSSVLVKKDLLLKYPMVGDQLHEDYVTWMQILKEIPCAYGINEPLLIYRLSANSRSANRISSAKMLYRSYRYMGYGAVRSAVMVFRYTLYSVNKRRKIFHS